MPGSALPRRSDVCLGICLCKHLLALLQAPACCLLAETRRYKDAACYVTMRGGLPGRARPQGAVQPCGICNGPHCKGLPWELLFLPAHPTDSTLAQPARILGQQRQSWGTWRCYIRTVAQAAPGQRRPQQTKAPNSQIKDHTKPRPAGLHIIWESISQHTAIGVGQSCQERQPRIYSTAVQRSRARPSLRRGAAARPSKAPRLQHVRETKERASLHKCVIR
jgi:hypothetical protein